MTIFADVLFVVVILCAFAMLCCCVACVALMFYDLARLCLGLPIFNEAR